MTHVPHELTEELPELAEKIAHMRLSNGYMARLCAQYHTVNRTVHRMENDIEPVSDETIRDERKTRLSLLDEIKALALADA